MDHNVTDLDQIARILHTQAWCRAKGELMSMLCTTWPNYKNPSDSFDRFNKLVEEFVEKVEEEGFHE